MRFTRWKRKVKVAIASVGLGGVLNFIWEHGPTAVGLVDSVTSIDSATSNTPSRGEDSGQTRTEEVPVTSYVDACKANQAEGDEYRKQIGKEVEHRTVAATGTVWHVMRPLFHNGEDVESSIPEVDKHMNEVERELGRLCKRSDGWTILEDTYNLLTMTLVCYENAEGAKTRIKKTREKISEAQDALKGTDPDYSAICDLKDSEGSSNTWNASGDASVVELHAI